MPLPRRPANMVRLIPRISAKSIGERSFPTRGAARGRAFKRIVASGKMFSEFVKAKPAKAQAIAAEKYSRLYRSMQRDESPIIRGAIRASRGTKAEIQAALKTITLANKTSRFTGRGHVAQRLLEAALESRSQRAPVSR